MDACDGNDGNFDRKQKMVLSKPLKELQDSIENDFEAVQVQWEDIVKVASRAKKSTGRGLCQLTPGHLKSGLILLVINVQRCWQFGRIDGLVGTLILE